MTQQASAEANTAYRAGLCRDCRVVPYSPGRTRCIGCHATYQQPPTEEITA